MKRVTGPPAELSKSLHQRLNMYALAAGAAGVSVLACAEPSEAKIVYTHVHQVIGPNSQFNLDLNHDGIVDFVIHNIYHSCSSDLCRVGRLWATLPDGNALEGTSTYAIFRSAYVLLHGAKIGPPKKFGGTMLEGETAAYGYEGRWRGATNRYLGVRFQGRDGRAHYGWARLTVRGGPGSKIFATLTGYAYETIPNKRIIAGSTKGADESTNKDFGPDASLTNPNPDTPQPATLGALAMGAPGLSIWKRDESVAAARDSN